jgi:hypothetical protein
MKRFNVADITEWNPCYPPTKHLPEDWSGTVIDILDNKNIPFEDRLWVIMRTDLVSEKLMRLFAVWCARQVQHLMKDARSIKAIDVAEAFANGLATKDELDAARDVARAAAWAAEDAEDAGDVARDVARAAAWAAGDAEDAGAAARTAAWAAVDAGAAARTAAWAAGDAEDAGDVARAAAWAADRAAEDAQENKLREMLIAGIDTGDVAREALKEHE